MPQKRAEEIVFLKDQGVTVIDQASGLDLDAFRQSVLAKVQEDYPDWQSYLERIDAVE